MKQAVFVEPGCVEWRDASPVELQGEREAVVRPLIVGRCDLDVAFVRGLMPMPSGAPIGHEIIAEVLEAGSSVGVKPGDRVFVAAQISCGECALCRRGATARCQRVPFGASYGMGREGGFGAGLSDRLRVPFADAMLTPTPPVADLRSLIGLADMATDAWRGVGPHLAAIPEARVLVIGGMPAVIGLFAASMAKSCGAAEVDYVDDSAARRDIASGQGIRCIALEQVTPATYDVVFVANPTRRALEAGFTAVAPAGRLTSAAPCIDESPILDTPALYHRGVSWDIGRPDCRGLHSGAMQAWSCCGFDPTIVPATVVDWDEAPEAWSSDDLYVVASRAETRSSAADRREPA